MQVLRSSSGPERFVKRNSCKRGIVEHINFKDPRSLDVRGFFSLSKEYQRESPLSSKHSSRFKRFSEPVVQFRYLNSQNDITGPATDFEKWSTEEVVRWALQQPDIKEKHARILQEQEVTGRTLLTLNEDKLRSIGLPLGPAASLAAAIEQLKQEKNKTSVYSFISERYLSLPIRSHDAHKSLISSFGSKMPIVQRNNTIKQSWENLLLHYRAFKAKDFGRDKHKRVFAYGGPGTGKTRLGLAIKTLLLEYVDEKSKETLLTKEETELKSLLQDSISIHITFTNGTKLILGQELGDSSPIVAQADNILGIRALYYGLQLEQRGVGFVGFLQEMKAKKFDYSLITALNIIKHFKSLEDKEIMWNIHIDEFNALVVQNIELFKNAVGIASQLLTDDSNNFYSLLFTGTSYVPMKEYGLSSGHPMVELPMKLLSPSSLFKVVKIMKEKNQLPWLNGEENWKENIPFIQCLGDTGGVPRALEYLLESITKQADSSRTKKLTDINVADAMEEAFTLLRQKTSFLLSPSHTTELIVKSFLQTRVQRKAPLECDSNVTFGFLEEKGVINLESVPGTNKETPQDMTDIALVDIPFIFLRNWISRNPLYYSQLFNPSKWPILTNPHYSLTWENWEQFVGCMEVLRTQLFIHSGRKVVTVGELLNGAKGNQNLLGKQIVLSELTYEDSENRFPNTIEIVGRTQITSGQKSGEIIPWWSLKHVVKNARGGGGFDVFSFRQKYLSDKYLAILTQCKWTELNTDRTAQLTKKSLVDAEIDANQVWDKAINKLKMSNKYPEQLHVMENSEKLFVAITNRQYADENIPDNWLVISKENLQPYFGPLSFRAAIALKKWN